MNICHKYFHLNIRDKTIEKKIFISFSLLFLILIVVIWSVMYPFTINLLRQRYDSEFKNYSDNVIEEYRNISDNLSNYAIGVTDNVLFEELTKSYKEANYLSVTNYQKFLINAVTNNYVVDGIFVYFDEKKLVISDYSIWHSLDEYMENYFEFEHIRRNEFVREFQNYKFNEIYLDTISYSEKEKQSLLFITNPVVNSNVVLDARIGIIIDFDSMTRNRIGLESDQATIMLYRDDQELISNEELIKMDDYKSQLKALPLSNDVQTFTIDKKEYYVLHDTVGPVMKCVIIKPKDQYIEGLSRMQLLINIMTLVLVIVGLLGIYFNAVRSVKPITRIKDLLEKTEGHYSEEEADELTWIESNIEKIVEKEREMLDYIKTSTKNLRFFYLSRLLENRTHDEEQLSIGLRIANIEFQWGRFVCLVIESDESKETILERLEAPFDDGVSYIHYRVYFPNRKRMVIILNYSEVDTVESYIAHIEKSLMAMSYRMGVGLNKTSVYSINESYSEAEKALNYKKIDLKDLVIRYKNVEDLEENKMVFTKDQETYLNNLLSIGEGEKSKNFLNRFIQGEIKKGVIQVQVLKPLYLQFLSIGFSAAKDSKESLREKYTINKLSNINDYDEILTYFYDFIDDVVTINEASHEDVGEIKLKEKIVQYIEQNYLDKNLNLTMIADHFGVHRVYVSKYFNEKMGVGLVEFVNRKRIDTALIYLQEDSYAIGQVSDLSGFNTVVTFRREFKKYTGITPSQYRNKCLD